MAEKHERESKYPTFQTYIFYNEEWFAITVGKIFTKKSPNGDFLVQYSPNRGLFGEKSP